MSTDRRYDDVRILHVAGGVEPELGGPTVAILNYLKCIDGPGMRSHLVAAVDDAASRFALDLKRDIEEHGGSVTLLERTGRFRGRASRWGISIPLARWLVEHVSDFDVIVTHGGWLFSSVTALLATRVAGKKFVLVPHESLTEFDVNRPGSRARIIAKRALKHLYSSNSALFLFTSRSESQETFPSDFNGQTAVVRYPVFDDSIEIESSLKSIEGRGLSVGFLGRLHEKKNVDVLLTAISQLPDSFTLTIGGIGDEKITTKLHDLAESQGIQERVTWRGFITAQEKNEFFRGIDVLVMPSAFESFGIVAAEAMLRGVPAIVARRTGIAELIAEGGGGIVVDPDATAVADALRRLASEPQLMERLSREAASTSRDALSFSSVGSQLREKFFQLVR